jgi:hypothetical protein
VTATARSNWFRAKRPSSAGARAAAAGEVADPGDSTGTGTGSPGDGASASRFAWADGSPASETLSAPVPGNQTTAGLPSRKPGANLFPGSAAGAAPQARPLPRRSPQQARSRLTGFQLGSRRAEGLTSSE